MAYSRIMDTWDVSFFVLLISDNYVHTQDTATTQVYLNHM